MSIICPKCEFEQPGGNADCIKCGIVFSKYNARLEECAEPQDYSTPRDMEGEAEGFLSSFFHLEQTVSSGTYYGRAILFLIILAWGWKFIFSSIESNYAGETYLHLVNLPFHEAGHVIFRPLGRFMTSIGGSLGQLLIPLVCLGTLLFKTKDTFGASVCLWWFGQNLIDLAPYINDARSLTLPLLGGNTGSSAPYGFHDWEFILTESGMLGYDHMLARSAHLFGSAMMIVALIWGGWLLFRQYKRIG